MPARTLSTACCTRSCCVLISISQAPRFNLMVTFGGFPVSDNSILLCLLSMVPLFEVITDWESSRGTSAALTKSNGHWTASFFLAIVHVAHAQYLSTLEHSPCRKMA